MANELLTQLEACKAKREAMGHAFISLHKVLSKFIVCDYYPSVDLELCVALERWLAFDLDRTIAALRKQLEDAPRVLQGMLTQYEGQKEIVTGQIIHLKNTMEMQRKAAPDAAKCAEPLWENLLRNLNGELEAATKNITAVQAQLKLNEDHTAGGGN